MDGEYPDLKSYRPENLRISDRLFPIKKKALNKDGGYWTRVDTDDEDIANVLLFSHHQRKFKIPKQRRRRIQRNIEVKGIEN